MFTGIIEEVGKIESIHQAGQTLQMNIHVTKITEDMKLGDSIAVNGVCLTVTKFSQQHFTVDVMPETFKSTSLAQLKPGSFVNTERAMAANGRFGGHFVSGHVDGTGTIVRKQAKENALYMDILIPEEGRPYCLPKGSIAIDGTSLTIFRVEQNQITISLIPHTRKETILANKMVGDKVNLEFDMLAKYMFSFYQGSKNEPSSMTMDYLKEHGFA